MRTWKKGPLAAIDTETTGVDTTTARIWEIGMVYRGGPWDKQSTSVLVNPDEEIPAEVIELCGLGMADLGEIAAAQPFARVAPRLLKRLAGHVAVGFNSLAYDLPLLRIEMVRCGAPIEITWPGDSIDVLVLVRRLRLRLGSHRLSDVADQLSVRPPGQAHRAVADCHMTMGILDSMLDELPDDLDELLALQAEWRAEQDADFERFSYWLRRDLTAAGEPLIMRAGKHKGLRLDSVPAGWLGWVIRNAPNWDNPLPVDVLAEFTAARRGGVIRSAVPKSAEAPGQVDLFGGRKP